MIFEWNLNPILYQNSYIELRYYSLLFLMGFIYAATKYKTKYLKKMDIGILALSIFLGVLFGARIGHVFFYEPTLFEENFWTLIKVWKPGLSSHGGLLGFLTSLFIFCIWKKINFFYMLDELTPYGLLICTAIRVGNFFNSEIIGIPTGGNFGIIFKLIDEVPRHPVQLYEALTYFFLYLFLNNTIFKISGNKFYVAILLGMTARFILEFFKVSQTTLDYQIFFSVGQWLCVLFILISACVLLFKNKNHLIP